jgi:phenylpropionate dioxygenase-like ring-hydroxylating dioxygenase large terminal subunit
MSKTIDPAALDNWYVIGQSGDLKTGQQRQTRLLGQNLIVSRDDGGMSVRETDQTGATRLLPAQVCYGHIWTTLGQPERTLFAIPEFAEPDRRLAACGAVRVKASGLRLVENFLDMAHFPFVHTDVLGTESKPEVGHYDCEVRKGVDEVWATNCKFWRPRPPTACPGGQMAEYTYRVPTPFNVMLYKACAAWPDRRDVIALFVQPVEEDLSLAYAIVLMVDAGATTTEIIRFQQTVFLQDRRWLKEKGLRFGVEEGAI